jgi:hypothetical protein
MTSSSEHSWIPLYNCQDKRDERAVMDTRSAPGRNLLQPLANRYARSEQRQQALDGVDLDASSMPNPLPTRASEVSGAGLAPPQC